jgi:hypothetical protein
VTGNARQGQLLQASVSDDDGVAGVVAWKWFADGVAVAGQTASTLQLSQEQVNKTITASASYTDGHGNVYAAAGVIGALAPVLSTASASFVHDLCQKIYVDFQELLLKYSPGRRDIFAWL